MKTFSFIILFLIIFNIGTYANSKDLKKNEKQILVEAIAETLKKNYVFIDSGNEMAQIIKDKFIKGKYSKYLMSQDLASQLEKDLFFISKDKHLHIVYNKPVNKKNITINKKRNMKKLIDNFGFKKVEILSGNIGYLKIDHMAREREAMKIASHSIQKIAASKAIIFDLRDNRGGASGMVIFLSSYLFDHPIHLYSMYNRLKKKTKDVWTFKDLPGKKIDKNKPVYILISSKTFSAAEGFAYFLKHHKRAIIIGEKSGGGAHPMIWINLPYNFMLCVPHARIIHPITKTDWEGTGVIPHHYVNTENALETAVYLINKDKLK